ncbi:MAG: tol-pal system YbgF family protein [Fidelibacterota bacterium]
MRNSIIFITVMLIQLGFAQSGNRYLQTEEEWKSYTMTQRMELISLCNFLYANQEYDRALLSFFSYIYKYPGDSLEPVAYYYIGRCYELTGQRNMAAAYFKKIRAESTADTSLSRLAFYRLGYDAILLDNEAMMDSLVAEDAVDPYLNILRGLVLFKRLKWIPARQAFKAAEAGFNDAYYSRLIQDMYHYLDQARSLQGKRRWMTVLASIPPGGGWAYLGDWKSAAGVFAGSVLPLALAQNKAMSKAPAFQVRYSLGSIIPYVNRMSAPRSVPQPISPTTLSGINLGLIGVGAVVYTGSIYSAVHAVDETNRQAVIQYIHGVIKDEWLEDVFINLDPEFTVK